MSLYVGTLLFGYGTPYSRELDNRLNGTRILFTISGEPDGGYRLDLQDDDVLLDYHDGGMFGNPFQALETDGVGFSVEFFGGAAYKWRDYLECTYLGGQWHVMCYYSVSYGRDAAYCYCTYDDYRTGIGYRRSVDSDPTIFRSGVEYEVTLDPGLPTLRSFSNGRWSGSLENAAVEWNEGLRERPQLLEELKLYYSKKADDRYLVTVQNNAVFCYEFEQDVLRVLDYFEDIGKIDYNNTLDPPLIVKYEIPSFVIYGDFLYLSLQWSERVEGTYTVFREIREYPLAGGPDRIILDQNSEQFPQHNTIYISTIWSGGLVISSFGSSNYLVYDLDGQYLYAIPSYHFETRNDITDIAFIPFQSGLYFQVRQD